jgi:hypothetical protein
VSINQTSVIVNQCDAAGNYQIPLNSSIAITAELAFRYDSIIDATTECRLLLLINIDSPSITSIAYDSIVGIGNISDSDQVVTFNCPAGTSTAIETLHVCK